MFIIVLDLVKQQIYYEERNIMSDIDELEKCYFELTGNDFTFLEKYGIPKTEISMLALLYDVNNHNTEEAIRFFIKEYRKVDDVWDKIYPHLRSFYEFYVSIFNNAEYKYIFELCANVYLDEYKIQPRFHNNKHYNELFATPIPDTTFVDLISGFNFYNFYDSLEKDTLYYLIDKSMLTCTYLEQGKKRKGLENVIILNADIKDVEREQIEGNISVVRIKNAWGYVNNFQNYIEKYKSMIMQGGIFLFQEDSVYKLLLREDGPYKRFNISLYFTEWEQKQIINFGKDEKHDSLIFKNHLANS
jgi:hypothetical protein